MEEETRQRLMKEEEKEDVLTGHFNAMECHPNCAGSYGLHFLCTDSSSLLLILVCAQPSG